MNETRYYTVDRACTIKDFLYQTVGCSTTFLRRVKYGGVTVNGEVVRMRHTLVPGDVVGVREPDEKSENVPPIPMELSVLYEDGDLLAVDKPSGMPVHPSRGNSLPTLASGVAFYYAPEPFVFRAVNRLDRDTSGIVLIAKNEQAAYRLSSAMQAGGFEKHYLARVVGVPDPASGTVDLPIAREAEGSMRRVVSDTGKRAVTEYETKTTLSDGTSLVTLRLLTGRTHQIRVHMAAIGHPLVADPLYGKSVAGETFFLRACSLSFPHPTTGERITITVPDRTERFKSPKM